MCENYRKIRNFCQFQGKPFTQKQAATFTGVHISAVRRHLKRLLERDYIMIIGNAKHSFVYDRTGRPEQVPEPAIPHQQQRNNNINNIVQAIKKHRCYNMSDIGRLTGLSSHTVGRYIQALQAVNGITTFIVHQKKRDRVCFKLASTKQLTKAIEYVSINLANMNLSGENHE